MGKALQGRGEGRKRGGVGNGGERGREKKSWGCGSRRLHM